MSRMDRLTMLCATVLCGSKDWMYPQECECKCIECKGAGVHVLDSGESRCGRCDGTGKPGSAHEPGCGGYFMRDSLVAGALRHLMYRREMTKSQMTKLLAGGSWKNFRRYVRVGLIRVQRRYDEERKRRDRWGDERKVGRDWVMWMGPTVLEICAAVPISEWDLVLAFWEGKMENAPEEAAIWMETLMRVHRAREAARPDVVLEAVEDPEPEL